MMFPGCGRFLLPSLIAILSFTPAVAEAQWYGAVYLGANRTLKANVTIDQPSIGRSLTFNSVRFDARPFQSPQYYGWRAGWLFGSERLYGAELEFIHLKTIGLTNEAYAFSGTLGPDPGGRMSEVVERYSMTHGLNLVLFNLAARTPFADGRATLWVRTGIGPTIPHAETTIDGHVREQYEAGGIGAQTGLGLDWQLSRYLSGIVDYKFTFARPRIDVFEGTGRTTAKTHHVTFGVAFGLPR